MSTTPLAPDAAELVQQFLDAFNEADATRRRATIEAVLAPDGVYTDPETVAEGHDGLDAAIAALRTRLPPGGRFSLRAPVDAHHHQARFAWQFGTPEADNPLATGTDVAVFVDGRIHRLYGFFDPPAVAEAR